jgi:glycosyltransferase involved in cell wall biosynthesis
MIAVSIKNNNLPSSVVIATLGGKSLISTIKLLNQGTVTPKEILVCIPDGEAFKSDLIKYENVRIISTPCRGQVAQRAYGFRHARYEFVLQLDDDMSVDSNCLELLLEALQILGQNAVVSPALINEATGHSVYERPKSPRFILTIYSWLMNGLHGYKPGTIDKAGSGIGIDPKLTNSRFIEVEWLAGGCVLHRRINLVLEDFWERSGKAYCEDNLHSHLLRQKGLKLFVDTMARCELEVMKQSKLNFSDFWKDFSRDYSARRYYMKRVCGVSVRMYIYYFIRFISYLRSRSY